MVKKVSKLTRPEDGSLRAALFLDKPDRKIYPDYYILVPRPTSFKVQHPSSLPTLISPNLPFLYLSFFAPSMLAFTFSPYSLPSSYSLVVIKSISLLVLMEHFIILQDITTKLKKGLYATIEDVETEFALMAHNARMYNLDTSPVFAECESLREEFHLKTAKIREHFELPDPPPFVVDANQSIPTPVLLDEHGVNIAIFTPPGVRPPLPERSRGYIIYNMGLVKPSNVALKTPTPAPNSSSSSSSSSGYKNNGGDVGPRSSSSSNLVAQQQQQQPAAKQHTTPQDQTIKKRPGPKPKRTASSDTIDAMDETYSPDRKKSKKDAVPGGGGGKEEKLYLSLFIPKKPSSASNSTDGVESVSSSSSYTEKAEKPEKGQNQGPESKGPLPRGSKVKLKGMGRWPV